MLLVYISSTILVASLAGIVYLSFRMNLSYSENDKTALAQIMVGLMIIIVMTMFHLTTVGMQYLLKVIG